MIIITRDTVCYYCMIELSCLSLVYDSCDRVITSAIQILLHWGQLRLYKLRRWWHEIYGIYMRVFLFGLFLRCINLMNSKSEPVQLVLSTLIFIALLYISLHAYVSMCSQYDFWYMLLLIRIYRYTCACLCRPLGFIIRTRWIAFWQPLDLHVQNLEFGLWWIFRGDQSVQWWRVRLAADRPCLFPSSSLLICSQDFFCHSRASVVLFTLCKFHCKSYFCISWWCNIHIILDHALC